MKQGEVKEPPKKKLKQAQLSFFSSPKPGSKRKIGEDSTSDDEVQFVKVLCKSPVEKSVDLEKENVCSNKTDSCEKKKVLAHKIVLQSTIPQPENPVEEIDLIVNDSEDCVDDTESPGLNSEDLAQNCSTKNTTSPQSCMPKIVLQCSKEQSKDDERDEIIDLNDDGLVDEDDLDECKPTDAISSQDSSSKVNIVSSGSVISTNEENLAVKKLKGDETGIVDVSTICDSDDILAVPLKAEPKSEEEKVCLKNTSLRKDQNGAVVIPDEEVNTSEPAAAQSVDAPKAGSEDEGKESISADGEEGADLSEQDNESSETPSKHDRTAVSSLENTPVSVRRSSVSSSDELSPSEESSATPSSVVSPKTPSRKLTPKQLLRREEKLKRREDREKLRQEKKVDKLKRREEIKLEKDKQRKKEKEEKAKKKQAELDSKKEEKRLKAEEKRVKREKEEEEKKKKEEDKRKKREEKQKEEEAKEEERRRKKEERRKEEEAKEEMKLLEKKKEEQAKAAFASFFKKPRKSEADSTQQEEAPKQNKFMPFPVKQDMMLSVVNRRVLTAREKTELDGALTSEADSKLYLDRLSSKQHTPLKTEATWPISAFDEQHDVIIIESIGDNSMDVDEDGGWKGSSKKQSHKHRAKLLQFCENRRPAYWGTWSKKPLHVSPRRPFSKEQGVMDYEVDSECEWEDEEEGESLEEEEKEQRSDDEEAGGGENGYILDTQFVPHGYLSDEEANSQDENLSPEAQKLRLTTLKEEFDEEMKQKAERLKPRLLGCVWVSNSIDLSSVSGGLYKELVKHRCVWDESAGAVDVSGEASTEPATQPPSASKTKTLPPPMVEALVRLMHGSQGSMPRLLNEFLDVIEKDFPTFTVTKRAVSNKMKQIATKTHDSNGKPVWSVNSDLWEMYGLSSVTDIVPAPAPQIILDKPKNTFMDSFLKGATPPAAKKRVQLMSPRVGSSEKKDEKEKKRCTLITLPSTPAGAARRAVHQDTPRPPVNKFLDLTREEPKSKLPAQPIDISEDTN